MTGHSSICIVSAFAAVVAVASTCSADEVDPSRSAVGPLLRILQSGDLPEDRLVFIFGIMAERGSAYDLGVLWAKATEPDGYEGKTRAAALGALAAAARQRGVVPEGDLAKLAAMMNSKTAAADPATYELAIELAGLWKAQGAAQPLAALATGKETSPRHRALALDALVNIGGDTARRAIDQLAADDQPQPLRYLAGGALARLDAAAAAPVAVRLLAAGTAKDDPAALVDAFLQQQDGSEKLAAAIAAAAQETISPDVAKLALRHIYSVGRSDQALTDALSRAAGIATEVAPPTSEELQALIADVKAKGDPRRGEQIFRRADLNCVKCHAINGAGGTVGPDLIDLGGQQSLDYLIESILLPDKAVKEEYQLASVVDYATGKQYLGILKEESDERIVLKDADGKQVVIVIDDPDEIFVRKGGSLMPQGLVRFLTRDELVDLVKFLSVLGQTEGPYAKNTEPIVRRFRVLNDVPPALAEDDPPQDEAIVDHVLSADETSFRIVYAMVEGRLPPGEFSGEGEGEIAYLQVELDVSSAGEIAVEVDGCEGTALWFGSSRLGEGRRVRMTLSEGRHALTLRVPADKCRSDGLMVRLVDVEGSQASVAVVQTP